MSPRGTGRTTGSWTPRLAGIAVAVLLAGGGTIAYLIASPRGQRHGPPPTVESVRTVGIVARSPAGGSGTTLLRYSAGGGLAFGPMPSLSLPQGDPQWTADTMTGGTLVFIYAPAGQCLASARRRHTVVLALRRCDLGTEQRWQRVGGSTGTDGHSYAQYRNVRSGRCLTAAAAPDDTANAAAGSPALLSRCAPAPPPSQLISFWWAA
jgi:hypothetical protein